MTKKNRKLKTRMTRFVRRSNTNLDTLQDAEIAMMAIIRLQIEEEMDAESAEVVLKRIETLKKICTAYGDIKATRDEVQWNLDRLGKRKK